MRPRTQSFVNILILLVFLVLIFLVIRAGSALQPPTGVSQVAESAVSSAPTVPNEDVFHHPLSIFIFQLLLILIASQVCARLMRMIGQPGVMGEIIAGILLGPSLLGSAFPGFTAFAFPESSLAPLQMLSQIGLVLFMFVIGMELDLNLLKSKVRSAVYISNASIIIPYLLGVVLSYFMYEAFAPPDIPFYAFALFMGIAMSITAFPVLARILRERGLTKTRYGTIAITSAAANDLTGWCVLAFVIAIVKAGSVASSFYTLIAAAVFVMFMVFGLRRILKRFALLKVESDSLRPMAMATIFLIMLVSAYISEVIGIHALFGAFLAGVIMPDEWNFRKLIIEKIEDVALVLLLPLFFVATGLRTEIGMLNDARMIGMSAIVTAVAILGKFGGSAFAARRKGENWHDSLAIGALMNTRGLMELVILNIGYDLGILSPQVFTMMVVMALVTTLMTSPCLYLIGKYLRHS